MKPKGQTAEPLRPVSRRPWTAEKIDVGDDVENEREDSTEVTLLYEALDQRMAKSRKLMQDVVKRVEEGVKEAFDTPTVKST